MTNKDDAPHTLLEQAFQETQYRDQTYNHQIDYVRGAIDRKLGRYLVISVVVALMVMGAYILAAW